MKGSVIKELDAQFDEVIVPLSAEELDAVGGGGVGSGGSGGGPIAGVGSGGTGGGPVGAA